MADKHDIQHSILEMQAKKGKLGLKKAALQHEISQQKEYLRYVAQGCEAHDEIVAKKNQLIAEMNDVELEISELKNDIKRRQALKDEVTENEQPKAKQWEAEITVMRDNYLKFAGDKTRVASLRAMAADFASDLTKILKKLK